MTATRRVLLSQQLHPDWVGGRRRSIRNELNDRITTLLEAAGAEVIRVANVVDAARTEADALVLPGGSDVDPGRYGAQPDPATTGVLLDQDDLDFALLAVAVERGLPVLGVCRGLQVLNVARGGTLTQDVAHDVVRHRVPGDPELSDREAVTECFVEHEVQISVASTLRSILGARVGVASGHHQSVDRLGDGLEVVGWSDDGVIEAIEDPARGLLAVQWHPECLGMEHGLFAAFVESIATRRTTDRRR